ncbi:pyridoxamine 5'-phosphate oxidase family protein [Dehalobacterium formicoaceticum]|uniref:Pyridoxamine 5'-phosphate oxidase family protein n=1 Tax=Dehalobacterium formicoaceticum TaxID=51515 RepID=A0ABT1YBH3_9FIRM|nr:pyridoxamine 5'-phosphate oxidase family protein [Dehalobacterium formicoaceticum]MCR6547016.1 pyridoxamine 5'-phosphate oxidase family protein [Dehalobacterium formicoaceticum]
MVFTDEIKDMVVKAPFITIVTVSIDGDPHAIVVGKGEIKENNILGFDIYKMEKTQQNIKANGKMQVIIATMEGGPKGFRLTGKACIEDKQVLFKAEKAEALL